MPPLKQPNPINTDIGEVIPVWDFVYFDAYFEQ